MQTADVSALLPPEKRALFDFVSRKLIRLSKFEPGWDGYHADTLRPASAADALRYVERLPQAEEPHVTMAGDGEVSVYITIADRMLGFDFPGDGTVARSQRASAGGWCYLGDDRI